MIKSISGTDPVDSALGARSAVVGSAMLGATVAMGALAYYIFRKIRHQERAFPPVGRLTVDNVSGPIGHETETAVSATDANATWPFAIAAEAIEYWRRSVDDSYAFLQRLTRAQELDDVIEIQSEFARRAYSDFITRPSKVVELCSNITREAFASYLNVNEAKTSIATHNEKDD
jgi:hypothetical protein